MDEEEQEREKELEQSWLTATEGKRLVCLMRSRGSDRKLRLVGCGLCRAIWVQLSALAKEAVEVAEGYADEVVDEATRVKYWNWLQAAGASDSCWIGKWLPACAVSACGWYAAELGINSGIDSQSEVGIVRDIFGNPFRPVIPNPAWLTSTVLAFAEGIYADRAFDCLPILADALQDAGCDNTDILDHCRGPGPHARGCWVVDLLLGKS